MWCGLTPHHATPHHTRPFDTTPRHTTPHYKIDDFFKFMQKMMIFQISVKIDAFFMMFFQNSAKIDVFLNFGKNEDFPNFGQN